MTTIIATHTLIGTDVCDREGTSIGTVKDVMLSLGEQRVAYVALQCARPLAGDQKLLAVPSTALRLLSESETLLLDVDSNRLERAAGFDAHHWPNSADSELLR